MLTPHLLLFADDGPSGAADEPRLALGVARTRELRPHEIGRRAQVHATRDAVLAACADAGLDPRDLNFAQIKCPLLTPERVAASPEPCATADGSSSARESSIVLPLDARRGVVP